MDSASSPPDPPGKVKGVVDVFNPMPNKAQALFTMGANEEDVSVGDMTVAHDPQADILSDEEILSKRTPTPSFPVNEDIINAHGSLLSQPLPLPILGLDGTCTFCNEIATDNNLKCSSCLQVYHGDCLQDTSATGWRSTWTNASGEKLPSKTFFKKVINTLQSKECCIFGSTHFKCFHCVHTDNMANPVLLEQRVAKLEAMHISMKKLIMNNFRLFNSLHQSQGLLDCSNTRIINVDDIHNTSAQSLNFLDPNLNNGLTHCNNSHVLPNDNTSTNPSTDCTSESNTTSHTTVTNFSTGIGCNAPLNYKQKLLTPGVGISKGNPCFSDRASQESDRARHAQEQSIRSASGSGESVPSSGSTKTRAEKDSQRRRVRIKKKMANNNDNVAIIKELQKGYKDGRFKKLQLSGSRTLKDGSVDLFFPSPESAHNVLSTLKDALPDHDVNDPTPTTTVTLHLAGLDGDIYDSTKAVFEAIISSNRELNALSDKAIKEKLQVIDLKKCRNSEKLRATLKVTPDLFRLFPKGRYSDTSLRLGFQYCPVFVRPPHIRCYRCQSHDGHFARNCKETKTCSQCGESHEDKEQDCTKPACCINCKRAKYTDLNHAASSPDCPVFKAAQKNE